MKWIGLSITSVAMGLGLAFLAQIALPDLMSGRFAVVAIVTAGVIFLLNVGTGHSNDRVRDRGRV